MAQLQGRARGTKRTEKVKTAVKGKKHHWFVYAIECDNGSVYIGQTGDLSNRWELHQKGKAARWTKKHPPVKLFYYETAGSLKEALKRETFLKKSKGRKWLKIILKSKSPAGEPAEKLLKDIKKRKD